MSGAIVITRPREDAEKLAGQLVRKGFDCIIEPILSIKILYGEDKSLDALLENKPQAILATSKHAISAFAALSPLRSTKIITIGRVTAQHAMKLGFSNVTFVNGSAHSIVSYATGNLSPADGRLLYIRGREISTDIAAPLLQGNFIVDSAVLYKAEKARRLSSKLCKAIEENKVDSIVFYSQNTVKTYAKLVTESNIIKAHSHINALCLSQAIADTARTLLPWKDVMLFPAYLGSVDT